MWQTCWMSIWTWTSDWFFLYFLPRMFSLLMWSSTLLMDRFEDSRFNSTTTMDMMMKQMTWRSMFSWVFHLANRLLECVDLRFYFTSELFLSNKTVTITVIPTPHSRCNDNWQWAAYSSVFSEPLTVNFLTELNSESEPEHDSSPVHSCLNEIPVQFTVENPVQRRHC